jgi:hypothetical protein
MAQRPAKPIKPGHDVFAMWRTGVGVVVLNALRYLEVL